MTSGVRTLLVVLFALAAAWLAFDAMVLLFGGRPSEVLFVWLQGTGSGYGFGQVLFKATPLLFTGVAVDVALRARLFNIGAEGQLMIAALTSAWVGTQLPPSVPSVIGIPLVTIVAAGAGAGWAAIPALLKVWAGAHEVISTIMMNRIADAVVVYALASMGQGQSVRTALVADSMRIPKLDAIVPVLRGSSASIVFVVGLVIVGLVVWSYGRTRFGKELVWIGINPRACRAEGMGVDSRVAQALLVSGALAGVASLGIVFGYKGYYEQGLGAGAGFGGLGVALLGRGSALGMVAAALTFGFLLQGGFAINAYVPKEGMDVLQGVILCAVALADSRLRAAWRGHLG